MAVRRVFFASVVLMIFLLLFGFQPEEIISRNILYCTSCAPLGFDSPGTSVGEITSLKRLDSTWRSCSHLGFRLHGKAYFRSRMNYHHNSTASFQLIRLVKSGDVSLNPGPTAIPVVIGNRRPTNCYPANATRSCVSPRLCGLDNLRNIQRQTDFVSLRYISCCLQLCLLNARSVKIRR